MDIDIDVAPSTRITDVLPGAIPASTINRGNFERHPVGVYLQHIPKDPETGFAAIPYDRAAEFDFFKFDFLNLHLLDMFTSKDEVRRLAETDPDWRLLRDPEVVGQLFHLSRHYDLVSKIAPTSVVELADCMALIRPGKSDLVSAYINDRNRTRQALYAPDSSGYTYKRGQAIAYATVIVLQLHIIARGTSISNSDMLEWAVR